MDLSNVETKINEILSDSDDRKIVMWYDESEEFSEEISNIKLDNAELFVLDEDNWIYAKYYIESENQDTNFLVYAPFRKPADEDNFLADMVHYATLFSADKINILCQELNIDCSKFRDVLSSYSSFWNASSRIKSFKDLNIQEYSKNRIELGILVVLAGERTLNFEYVVRKIIVKHFEKDDSIIEKFDKYNILNVFWDFVYQKFGYREDNPTIGKFTISLVLNYTASLFEGNTPKSWDRFLIEDKNNPRVFIDNFMNNTNYNDTFDNISSLLEDKLNISRDIKNYNVDSYIKCDSFKTFDRKIINHYINLLNENKEKIEFNNILELREKGHFYNEFEDEYQLIYWANEFIGLIHEFQREILPDDVNELINSFANRFVNIDKAYRKFYYHYDLVDDTDHIRNLQSMIENMYTNIFLFEINPKFTNLIENIKDISITKQWRFYKTFIFNNKTKTIVIISDALRYGCGVELKEELDLNVKEEELKYLFTIERHQDISDDIHINTFDDVYLLHRNLDCEKTKLQKKELTDIMFIYYEYLEEQYKKKNDNFVPASEEHDKLFKYLHKNLKKCYIDLNFTYTKDDLLDLALYKSIYNFRNIVIIILAIILMIIGFTKYMWLFYFSIFFIPMYFMINDYIARRKVNNTLYLMEKTNTFKDNIKLHDEYFRCKNLKDIVIFYAGLKIVENKSHIFIFLNRDNAIILNKKDMHNDDIEFLKNRKGILYKKIK